MGICVLDFKLNNNEEVPNKPESKGNNGSFAVEFNIARPKQPDNVKRISANNFDSLSFKIRKIQAAIKI